MEFQHTATRRWLAVAVQAGAVDAVSTHSHPKVAAVVLPEYMSGLQFQHTATRRWLLQHISANGSYMLFQHTATRRWLSRSGSIDLTPRVSTHSHPKVAARTYGQRHPIVGIVSTHSHPKVAASPPQTERKQPCFNTQPPEGGCPVCLERLEIVAVSTHSHPKVAAPLSKVLFHQVSKPRFR